MRSKSILCLVYLFVFTMFQFCYADEASIKEELSQLKARIQLLENRLEEQKRSAADYEAKFKDMDEQLHRETGVPAIKAAGLEIGAGATMIVQGTGNTNATEEKKTGRTNASFSEDITISKEFEGLDSKAFLHLEAGQGAGLTDELSLYSNVNYDANDEEHVSVSEIWYEQGMFGDKALIVFGKLDPTVYFDTNEIANDETTEFLSDIFRNNPAIEFPDNTVGIRAAALPFDWLELNYGAFNTNGNWDKISDNLLNIGQVTFKTNFFNLPGNYRFLGWQNRADHTEWLDEEKQKEPAYGFALSFDQKVHDIVTLFTRYGWQDPKVFNPDMTASGDLNYSLKHSWSAGLQIEGKPWHRENDILAFAVGQAIPSNDYKKSFDPEIECRNEGHFEAYYKIHINDHLSISPDFQYIWNPFGKDIADDTNGILVGGMRAQVDF
ncbi:MAG: carbohydrate porin [Candidatus Omnitrophota bacterium]